jgi:hypothetical protein
MHGGLERFATAANFAFGEVPYALKPRTQFCMDEESAKKSGRYRQVK